MPYTETFDRHDSFNSLRPGSPLDAPSPVAHEPIEALVEAVAAAVRDELRRRRPPAATYRLQLHEQFGFDQVAVAAGYLQRLGVSHLYLSPFLQARSRSRHGYDVVDPARINVELGGDAGFERLCDALRRLRLEQILDVVPNHLGIGSDENPWWQDLLENGPSSPYARFFDVDWEPLKPDLRHKVLLPVLGDQFGAVLEAGLLRIEYDAGRFWLRYYDRRFPVAPRSSLQLLRPLVDPLRARLGDDAPEFLEYQSILTALANLPRRDETDPARRVERLREKEVVKRRLDRLAGESPDVRAAIDEAVTAVNGRPGDPSSFDRLDELLAEQPYRLSYWRTAADEINYRRFFDVNELAAVCMERPEVFDRTHELVLRLLDSDRLAGLRIDHADGLFDPAGYLRLLQERRYLQHARRHFEHLTRRDPSDPRDASPGRSLGLSPGLSPDVSRDEAVDGATWERVAERLLADWRKNGVRSPDRAAPLYLVVEKILGAKERLPADWPVRGTTGYEFLKSVNDLLVEPRHERALDRIYRQFTGERTPYRELVYQTKRLTMKVSMASELNALGYQLDRISERGRASRDFTLNGLTYAVREIAACFPIYRTYVRPDGGSASDRRTIEQSTAAAKRRNPAINSAVFDFVRDVLLLTGVEELSEEVRAERRQFVGRFQQFTGPVTAKAVEDTTFYVYNRLISLNEVGGDPDQFGASIADFHQANSRRLARTPLGLLATSTHDTKRSEDVRARIAVLSELPELWHDAVRRWSRGNEGRKTEVDGRLAPSRNDEYLIYQTLVGTWPFERPAGPDLDAFLDRIQQYLRKAQREAKRHTSWVAPHEAYERATQVFLAGLLRDDSTNPFFDDLHRFVQRIARHGVWNSLSQTLLKLASPGVCDVYQGCELWDFSLVDPDNRRPVDFARRARLLEELDARWADVGGRAALADELTAAPEDGRIKLFVTARGLRWRRAAPRLFSRGRYLPLEATGEASERLAAFARASHGAVALALAPVRTAVRCGPTAGPPCGRSVWGDSVLRTPEFRGPGFWRCLFTGRTIEAAAELPVADLLDRFPVGLFSYVRDKRTDAGERRV